LCEAGETEGGTNDDEEERNAEEGRARTEGAMDGRGIERVLRECRHPSGWQRFRESREQREMLGRSAGLPMNDYLSYKVCGGDYLPVH